MLMTVEGMEILDWLAEVLAAYLERIYNDGMWDVMRGMGLSVMSSRIIEILRRV